MHHDFHPSRPFRALTWFPLLVAALLTSHSVTAQERRWRNPNPGAFQNAANWTGSVVPGPGDPATFGLTGGTNPFSVSFSADAQNSALNVTNQRPVFDLAGFTYALSGPIFIGGLNSPALDVTGGVLQSNAHLFVGQGGPGALSVLGGATARAVNISVGNAVPGSLTVRGTGSRADSTGSHAEIGFNSGGTGTVLVDQGGSFSHGVFMHIGRGIGAAGSLTVRDSGSLYSSPFLHIGDGGASGSLLVENGGDVVCSDHIDIARNSPNSVADVTVRGAGSSVATGGLSCSGGGRGNVLVEAGGRLNIAGESNQWHAGTRQSWIVRGAGSEITFGGTGGRLFWPEGESSSIRVFDGAAVRGSEMRFGSHQDAHELVMEISGPDSTVDLTRGFFVDRGTADVKILDGARMTALDGLQMGCCGIHSAQSMLVRGADSELVVGDWPNTGGNLFVGLDSDNKSLVIDQGARLVVENNAYVGHRGQGSLTIDGAGSAYESPHRLHVGWGDANSQGSLSLTGGASAWLGSLWMSGGPASSAQATISEGSIMIVEHGGEVYQNATLVISNGGGIETSGYINLYGAADRPARMIVSGPSAYHYGAGVAVGGNPGEGGPGVLTLADGGLLYATGGIHIRRSGTFHGSGQVEGSIYSDGRFIVGEEQGSLVCRNVYLSTNSVLSMQIGGLLAGSQYDVLAPWFDASLAGCLELSLANGFTPSLGQTFEIVTAAPGRRTGQFDRISGSDLGNAKAFALQYLTDRVRLHVDAVTGVDASASQLLVYNGFTEPLALTAHFSALGAQNVTSSATWTSDNPAIASVNADGRVTGHAPGTTTIRASFAGFDDAVVVNVLALPVPQNTLPGLNVEYRLFRWPFFEQLDPVLVEQRAQMSIPWGAWDQYGSLLNQGDARLGGLMIGTLNVPIAGEYTFHSVDGWGTSRVLINGKLVIADNSAHESQGVLALPAGPVTVRFEFAKYGNYAGYGHDLQWSGPGISRQRIPAAAFAGPISMSYYHLPAESLPNNPEQYDPANYPLFAVDDAPALQFEFNKSPNFTGKHGGECGATFGGWLVVPQSATYTLWMRCDEGARLYINGAQAARSWGWGDERVISIPLTQGPNELRVEAYERSYFQGLTLEIEGPGISRQLVPPTAFRRAASADCVPCDTDCNGTVNQFDIQPFINTLNSHTGCSHCAGDANGNGTTNQFDIFAFIDCLAR